MGTGKDRLWPTAAGVGREEAPDDVNALYGDLYIPRFEPRTRESASCLSNAEEQSHTATAPLIRVNSDRLKALFSSNACVPGEESKGERTSKALSGDHQQENLSPEEWAKSLFGQDVNTHQFTAAPSAEDVSSLAKRSDAGGNKDELSSKEAASVVRLSLPAIVSRLGLNVQRFERGENLQEELAAWRRQRAVMRIDCLRQHKTARRRKAKFAEKDCFKV